MKPSKVNEDPLNSPITNRLLVGFYHIKRAVADYLNDKVNRLSDSHKKVSFLMFGLIVVAIFLFQVLQSLQDTSKSSLTIDKITVPKDIHTRSDEEKSQQLKNLLDSLRTTKRGTQFFDSLVHARPGLMDSVNLYLHNYQTH